MLCLRYALLCYEMLCDAAFKREKEKIMPFFFAQEKRFFIKKYPFAMQRERDKKRICRWQKGKKRRRDDSQSLTSLVFYKLFHDEKGEEERGRGMFVRRSNSVRPLLSLVKSCLFLFFLLFFLFLERNLDPVRIDTLAFDELQVCGYCMSGYERARQRQIETERDVTHPNIRSLPLFATTTKKRGDKIFSPVSARYPPLLSLFPSETFGSGNKTPTPTPPTLTQFHPQLS